MTYDTLYALVFASQVLLMSGMYPARVQALGRRIGAGPVIAVPMHAGGRDELCEALKDLQGREN